MSQSVVESSLKSEGNSLLWYAVRTRPRFEMAVAKNLHSKGYEEYLPTFRCRRRWSDRIKEIELPLFPGYLFCRMDIQHRLPVLVVPGVLSIVGIGRCPMAVPDSEVQAVQRIAGSGLHYEPWPMVKIGQLVSVEHGPLQGLLGRVVDTRKNYRIVVSVELLQRSVSVEIDRDSIKPVESSTPISKVRKPNLVGVS